MVKNIFSYIALGYLYPERIFVNKDDNGNIIITVISHHARGGFEGKMEVAEAAK